MLAELSSWWQRQQWGRGNLRGTKPSAAQSSVAAIATTIATTTAISTSTEPSATKPAAIRVGQRHWRGLFITQVRAWLHGTRGATEAFEWLLCKLFFYVGPQHGPVRPVVARRRHAPNMDGQHAADCEHVV